MQFLPIVERELRVAARQSRTWWRRVLTLLIALIIFGMTWVTASSGRGLGMVGSAVFASLSIFGLIYALLSGPLATADCLSRERREGTLGLLFLTDLRSFDVVLGKIAASSLDVFLALMAALPLLAIPVLAGGVTLAQFGQVVLVLASAMMLSLSAGVFTSSVLQSGRASVALTLAFLLFLTLGLPLLGEELFRIPSGSWLAAFFYMVCPLWTTALSLQPGMTSSSVTKYWLGIGGMQGLAWIFLALACARTASNWRDLPESKFASGCRQWLDRMRNRATGATLARRRKALVNNPVTWLESRDQTQGWALAALIAGSALFWLIQHFRAPTRWPDHDWVFFWPAWSHYLLCLWIAIQAPRRLADDKQSGALELLLCTSLRTDEVLRGMHAPVWGRFGRALLALVLLDALLVMAYLSHHPSWNGPAGNLGLLSFWAALVFPLQGYAFTRVGLYQALLKGNSLKATFNLVFTLGVLPWGLFVIWMILAENGRRSFGLFPRVTETFVFTSWAVAHLLVLGLFLSHASLQLRDNFRALAASSPIPWWKRRLPGT